jgi:MFS family permease
LCDTGTLFFWLFSLSFAASIDFSVVLPTMFDYIKLFNGTIWFYGLCFGCYSICFFFSCLLLGYLADRRPFKELLLFCGLCLFGGNLLYCVDAAGSKYSLLLASFSNQ